MRVYHFINKEYGLQSLEERSLKVSRITETNDPFEFSSLDLSDAVTRKKWKAVRDSFSQQRGMLCFSKNWSSPLLWGHYAEKHSGLCLGFDFDDNLLSDVSYSRSRLSIKPENINENKMVQVLNTKYEDWLYEEEVRCFTRLENPDKKGNYFADFSDRLSLQEIIVGCNSKISRDDISKAMNGNFPHIKPFKARVSFRQFKIVRTKDDSLWK